MGKLDTTQRDSARTSPHAGGAPLFDAAAVRDARPAEPLPRAGRVRSRRLPIVLMVVVGAAAGGLVGGLVAAVYHRGPIVQSTADSPNAATAERQQTTDDASQTPGATAEDAQAARPSNTAAADAGEETSAARAQAERQPAAPAEAPASGEARAELRAALDRWIAATNERNVERQMNFYGERVNAFYLTRNATREAVRAEKARVIGGAASVNVSTGEPDISVGPDGRTATMRFRKRYRIEDRAGEVVQELRWLKTADGWKIISERDLRVIN